MSDTDFSRVHLYVGFDRIPNQRINSIGYKEETNSFEVIQIH